MEGRKGSIKEETEGEKEVAREEEGTEIKRKGKFYVLTWDYANQNE